MHNTALLANGHQNSYCRVSFPIWHSPLLLTACHHSSLIRTHRCNLTTKLNDPLVLIFLRCRPISSHSRSPSGWAARRRARTRPVRVIRRHTLAHTGNDAICTNPRLRRLASLCHTADMGALALANHRSRSRVAPLLQIQTDIPIFFFLLLLPPFFKFRGTFPRVPACMFTIYLK